MPSNNTGLPIIAEQVTRTVETLELPHAGFKTDELPPSPVAPGPIISEFVHSLLEETRHHETNFQEIEIITGLLGINAIESFA